MVKEAILVPTFSGIFDLEDKKTCLIVLESKYIPYLIEKYRPQHILNLDIKNPINKKTISEDYIDIENIKIDFLNKSKMKFLIGTFIRTHNVIIHTDNLSSLQEIVKMNLYDLREDNVALSSGAGYEFNIKKYKDYIYGNKK